MEKKKRSNSFDTLNSSFLEDTELSEMEVELLNGILMKKQLKKRREGFVHVKVNQWSWLWCSYTHTQWQRQYLTLTQDRVILSDAPENHKGVHLMLANLNVSLSQDPGHLQKYFCLNLDDGKQVAMVSLADQNEMQHWLAKIQDAVQQNAQNFFYVSKI